MQAAAFATTPLSESTLRIRGTSCVVGGSARIKSGLVIVLPQRIALAKRSAARSAPNSPKPPGATVSLTPSAFVDALVTLLVALRADKGEFAQPDWARRVLIANEGDLVGAVGDAESALQRALSQVDEAKGRLKRLQRRKLLITGTGKALEAVVEEALIALGFTVEEGQSGRTDRLARHTRFGPAVVEVKGKGKSAAERDCAQLEKWVSEHHLAHDEKPKAILVVNAWRDLPLSSRSEPAFPDQMVPFAAGREHCLMTGAQLLCAWLDAERYPERVEDIARAMFECKGRFASYVDSSEFISAGCGIRCQGTRARAHQSRHGNTMQACARTRSDGSPRDGGHRDRPKVCSCLKWPT